MIEHQLSIFLENKPGVLAEVCESLAEAGINIKGFSVSDTVDHAVVRMVVDEPTKALHLFGERGALVVDTEILAVRLANKPGALQSMAKKLADAKVNIEYAYGAAEGPEGVVFVRVSDLAKGRKVLGA